MQIDRSFTYDDAGKLLSATETEDNYGTYVYTYEYDLMGNRTAVYKTDSKGKVVESEEYSYNESNQVIKVALYDGKKNTTIAYTYDKDGNRISEIGKIGTDKIEKYYEYTVENRLAAVYDADELLMAVAYDGDGNRVFQLNYNLHTDEDWKGNSGNGNGNNKDNKGSGNNGKGSSNNGKGNSKSTGTDDAGYGNATNAEEHNSQNQSGILFPIDEEVSETEQSLIDQIKTTGKEKNYELIEYLNDVNREYVEVLVEQNINGKTDTFYVYGVNRLSLDRFDGSTGYYLYDPRGSVVGITNEEGQIYQSYRYSTTGEITFGAPQYENEYTYNGESYNPNIESQYLRARYYNVVTATFLTEDSYLGNINEPLTLNRYNYCVSSYLNYRDPSGNDGKIYYLNNIDGAKFFGHNAILIVDSEGEGSFYSYMAEGLMSDVIMGESVVGYMGHVSMSSEEVTEFLQDGIVEVIMPGGNINQDEYDQALYTKISDEDVERAKQGAQEYIDEYKEYKSAENMNSYLGAIPQYNFYAYNCDTVASLIAHSIDDNFVVYTLLDAIKYIDVKINKSLLSPMGTISIQGLPSFTMGMTIAAPNMSFLYSKELDIEGWEYLSIGKNSKEERYLLKMWKALKWVRKVMCE